MRRIFTVVMEERRFIYVVGWHLNHGTDQAPDFYSASRFRDQFYRPDVVARVMDTLDVDKALRLADQERGRKTITRDLRDILPPQITILAPRSGTKTDSTRLTLTYLAASSTGPITDIEARVDSRPAVLFFDTCHSGNILRGVRADAQQADVDKFANELADAETGVIVFCSSTGKQFSVEKENWQNGAFTEALLEGIRGMADYHKDRYISIAELEVYLSERVKELTQGEQKPMTAKPKTIEDFKFLRVSQSNSGG